MWKTPAYCPHCDHVFEFAFANDGISGTLSVEGLGTDCPECGEVADILDGTYAQLEGALRLVHGSTFTRQQFARLEQLRTALVKASNQGNTNAESEVIQAISAVSPELGAAIKLLKVGSPQRWLFVVLLVSIVLKQCSPGGGGITINMNIDQSQSHQTVIVEGPKYYLSDPSGNLPQAKSDRQVDTDGGE